MNEILQLKKIKKSYQLGQTTVPALKEINLNINKGEIIGIVGASGSGKSTLLNIIGCIDHPDSGEVLLNNRMLKDCSELELSDLRNRTLGFVFQSFNLIPVLNVLENIEVPLLIRKEVSPESRREKAKHLANLLGLTPFLHHRPDSLSGGQRQRVAIARALIGNPQIVIADEPTANLDSENATVIIELILRLGEELKTTFVIASHDERLLKRVKRIVTIKDGVILES